MSTYKDRFREVYPSATDERQVTNSGEVYYLVRKTKTSQWYAGGGSTRSKAWKDAWNRHEATVTTPPPQGGSDE